MTKIKEIVFQKKTNLILKKVNEHKYIYICMHYFKLQLLSKSFIIFKINIFIYYVNLMI